MKVVSWNVNSLKARAEYVAGYLDAEEPDVLCLQELKLPTDKVPRGLFEERGYELAIHGQKQWNGVLIASKQPLTDVVAGLPEVDQGQARMVAATTGGVRFVNLYCPQGQSVDSPQFLFKLAFFDGLIEWLRAACDLSAPLVVLGDLNIAPTPDDVWDVSLFDGVPTYHPDEHERWARLLELGLSDVGVPGMYTFYDYRGGDFRMRRGLRIDHMLVTAPLVKRVGEPWADRQHRKKKGALKPSDHVPLAIEIAD